MASFSSASFSTDAFSVLAFDFGSTPPAETEFGGHFVDLKRYRKQLQALAKAYEAHDESQYIKRIVETSEISEEIPIPTREVSQAADAIREGRIPQIDYEQFTSDIHAMLAYIERQVEFYKLQQEEEEMALLMLL